jgi:hypothetical protein
VDPDKWLKVGTPVGLIDDGEEVDGDWIWQAYLDESVVLMLRLLLRKTAPPRMLATLQRTNQITNCIYDQEENSK